MRETTHGLLRRDAFEKGEVVHVNYPCCKKRLFDLEIVIEKDNMLIRFLDGSEVRVESGGAFAESVSEGIGGKIDQSVVNYG